MRGLTLYLRSRRVPMALASAVAGTAGMWSLCAAFSASRDADPRLVVLLVLLLVAIATATLGGPDDELDRTAALRWLPRRALHLLAAAFIVLALLLATLLTDTRFGPAAVVIRDAAGLLGLTALSATAIGVARSWFLPLGWTLAAVALPLAEQGWAQVLTWQSQAPGSFSAAVTAGLLALGGLVAYAVAGPARCAPVEPAL